MNILDASIFRNTFVSTFKISHYYWGWLQRKRRNNIAFEGTETKTDLLCHLRNFGYAVIPNFYSVTTCKKICDEIDRIMIEQKAVVRRDKENSDNRVFGSEKASNEIFQYYSDEYLKQVGESYFKGTLINHTTLAGRLTAVENNKGSGGGWHRDSFGFQYKALIYLSDVSIDQGPFQIIEKSHRFFSILKDTYRAALPLPPESRISDDKLNQLLAADSKRLKTITGKAGTLLLIDSSSIHRGMPIREGIRYALTNYYYAPYQIDEKIIEKFEPYASHY